MDLMYVSILVGYEIKEPSNVQPVECQQQCSYDTAHTDVPSFNESQQLIF